MKDLDYKQRRSEVNQIIQGDVNSEENIPEFADLDCENPYNKSVSKMNLGDLKTYNCERFDISSLKDNCNSVLNSIIDLLNISNIPTTVLTNILVKSNIEFDDSIFLVPDIKVNNSEIYSKALISCVILPIIDEIEMHYNSIVKCDTGITIGVPFIYCLNIVGSRPVHVIEDVFKASYTSYNKDLKLIEKLYSNSICYNIHKLAILLFTLSKYFRRYLEYSSRVFMLNSKSIAASAVKIGGSERQLVIHQSISEDELTELYNELTYNYNGYVTMDMLEQLRLFTKDIKSIKIDLANYRKQTLNGSLNSSLDLAKFFKEQLKNKLLLRTVDDAKRLYISCYNIIYNRPFVFGPSVLNKVNDFVDYAIEELLS